MELIRLEVVPHDPIAWLFTTTKRRAMNQSRSQSRRRNRNQRAGESKSEASGTWFGVQLEKQEEAEQLQRHLEQLGPLEREIVVAHVWGELTFAQIAELVKLSSSTAHRHYQTALAKLKQAWAETSGNTVDPDFSANKHQSAREPRPNPFLNEFLRANL